jgi:hypothetical protein
MLRKLNKKELEFTMISKVMKNFKKNRPSKI